MESRFRSALILLFHFLAFITLAGDIVYQRYNVITPGAQSFAGRWKYLTFINENLQSVYFLLSFVVDVLVLLRKHTMNSGDFSKDFKFQDFMFSVAVFPIGMFVAVSFWGIYAVNRELIYPEILDTIIPKLCNHIMHTAILVFIMLEAFLVHHQHPSQSRSLVALFIIGLSYFAWMVWQKYFLSQWPYPFLDELSTVQLIVFLFISYTFLCVFYFLGKCFTNLREKRVTLDGEYSLRHAGKLMIVHLEKRRINFHGFEQQKGTLFRALHTFFCQKI